ncbi:XdhC family protein [Streptomyces spinoverrucosus]|uniref:XdhC family protein n=1 Tax=Streptomyces spinoverrucosus TaxID=284043 RepID=UPI0018C3DE34|nr:XdhC/CoxI family protein [Streptomyces spinoverrucosus]MBG0857286.1 XdhC family protein [Streptomyces spinoverrucosus]
MLDIADELHRWAEEGRDFAVATVIAVSGSAPRAPGAALAVDTEGTAIGSVSGGCVEGAVYDLCVQSLQNGETIRQRFGYSDEDAFAVGLTCGGEIEVLITPVTQDREVITSALRAAARGEPMALAQVAAGPTELIGKQLLVHPDGTYETNVTDLDEAPLKGRGAVTCAAPPRGRDHPQTTRTRRTTSPLERIATETHALLEAGRTGTTELCDLTLFVQSRTPPPRLIIFGAIDFAAALTRTAKLLGYHVTLCDARPVFATRARFPEADDIVVDWPHRYLRRTRTDARTVLCVLTHDAKFDVPLLTEALRLPVAYVGAMGSRRTHEDRERRLREAGLGERELARLRSPIGLDLGARTPEETAVSIAAEIIAARRGGTGVPLTDSGTPIHREEAMTAA